MEWLILRIGHLDPGKGPTIPIGQTRGVRRRRKYPPSSSAIQRADTPSLSSSQNFSYKGPYFI